MSAEAGTARKLIAVCGKGGVGKTVLTAMLANILAQSGRAGRLLLIDADPAMGLPATLGVRVKRTMGQVREDIIRTARRSDPEKTASLVNTLDYMVLEALMESQNYAVLAMGRTETLGCYCPVNDLLRAAIASLSGSFDTILIDGEAGLEQLNRQVIRDIGLLIIVSDATSRGIETARIVKSLVTDEKVINCERLGLVYNRVQDNRKLLEDSARVVGLEVMGYVPLDSNIAHRDLMGQPITTLPADSPGLQAARQIAERFILRWHTG
ncbi:MAG: AAA family ATPase [Dehalococcoidia bacterium]|nr:AAA family ATPase [Dehalococcoidia bacterium]